MDISMDIHGYVHGYPRKICGYGYEYGYGWQISYPRQACETSLYLIANTCNCIA